MEKQEKNCRPDNLYYCGIVLPLAGILFLALLRLLKIPLNRILLPCIFHKLTGLYCPGCGGTRAVYWLLKGNVAYSLHYHSIVLYGAVLYVCYMLSNTVQYVSRGRITIGMKYRPVYGKIAVVLLVVNTIWKNGNLLLFHKGL